MQIAADYHVWLPKNSPRSSDADADAIRAAHVTGPYGATRRLCFGLGRSVRLWFDYWRSLRELDSLDDRDLRDLRVNRGEISDLAWSEARRRRQSGA
jgi:uncharacterized protein YjiS (DUF1127 family)